MYVRLSSIYTKSDDDTPMEALHMKYESIGRNIRKYRTEHKLKQDELAEKAGLSSNYIGMVERGEKIPSLESLINILNSLEISADMVLCDVLSSGYRTKNSLLLEQIATLSKEDQRTVYAVIESLVANLRLSQK